MIPHLLSKNMQTSQYIFTISKYDYTIALWRSTDSQFMLVSNLVALIICLAHIYLFVWSL